MARMNIVCLSFLWLFCVSLATISFANPTTDFKTSGSVLQLVKSFEQKAQFASNRADSLIIIKKVLAASNASRYSGNYDEAFDLIWDAKLLSDYYGLVDMNNQINRALGILYDIYNKDSLALKHLNLALLQSKQLVEVDSLSLNQLISSYFSIATFWRDRGQYEQALQFLDSCEVVNTSSRELPYVLTDKGYCNLKLGNLSKAEHFLRKGKSILQKLNSPYLVHSHYFLGELMLEQYQYDSALVYMEKSLNLMETMKVHTEIKPELLEKISEVHIVRGNLLKAVNSMKASKLSYEKLFSATSDHNQRLFEINNRYEAELVNNQKVIIEQKDVIKKKNRNFLSLLILFGFSILTGFGIYLFVYQRNRYRKLALIARLDSEKSKAILDVKSRELTAYALKMIELEDSMRVLQEELKAVSPEKYKSYESGNVKGRQDAWDEFNQRFTEVNTHFYETLCAKHPNLSSTELKHCALIKLNFNSHEMSKILNISQSSVHTSRYRIRKKIGLSSNSSLTTYIGSI